MASTKPFQCPQCPKSFSNSSNLSQHVRQVHDNERLYPCTYCNRYFKRNNDKNRHESKCKLRSLSFNQPQEQIESPVSNKRNKAENHISATRPQKKARIPGGVREVIDPVVVTDDLLPNNADLHDIFKSYWSAIRTQFVKTNRVQDLFNFRLDSNSTLDLEDELYNQIFEHQSCSFKIDVDYGFILRNNETGDLRYYHSCGNNSSVLAQPHLVKDRESFGEFLNTIMNLDILEWARQQRPNSKWVVEMVTNITFFINKILKYPIGAGIKLPAYILNNPGLMALHRDSCHQVDFDDNLCLFRCLALGLGERIESINTMTKALFNKFVTKGTDLKAFPGVTLDQLPEVERVFNININVYALRPMNDDELDECENVVCDLEESKNVVVTVVRRSLGQFEKTINLNLFENHYSFIKNFDLYSRRFVCRKCSKLWTRKRDMERHEVTCEATIRRKFVGGVFQLEPTVFEELEEEGIFVDKELRFYPYCATFDFEAFLKKSDLPTSTSKQEWVAEHTPLSVSLCSNVPGYTEPVCYVNKNSIRDLISNMINQLQVIADTAYKLLLQNFEAILGNINLAIQDGLNREPSSSENQKQLPLEKMKTKLEAWMKELPVFSFNGGKYDINLIKPFLVRCLLEQNSDIKTIKKNSAFVNLKTEKLNFLDIANCLAPGFSYDKFLKAYKCPVNKGYLPYEWIDSLEKLKTPFLPSHEAFYSSLKRENISAEEYAWCQQVWTDHGMTTFKDFLIFYNNRDVQPFVEGILKMAQFYRQNDIDMMKDGISVPGLTLRYLFQNLPRDTYFTLFDKKNSDLHYLVKDNITGGPAIVFHRYHEVGKTKIREMEYGPTAKLCQSVIGFDCNALYLNCLTMDLPCSWFVRRRAPEFKAETSHKFGRMALEWLEFEAAREGIEIKHMFNSKEKRIGARNLPVDGACKSNNTLYEMNGCFWHGHECHINAGRTVNEVRGITMRELREETEKKAKYIRHLGYNLKVMWECEWLALRKSAPVKNFIDHYLPRKVDVSKRMTEREILQLVKDDTLFGMVECDIEVPPHLRSHFSEMQPIYKNVEVSKEDIGLHMKTYAESHGYLKQPRRMLIASYFGNRILLATPLLRWYLLHGLVVTKVYQVLEYYEKKACFKPFGESVSNARRAGDNDPEKAIVADTMKLLGNSGYGKTVTNKENHSDIKFVDDDYKASELVNEHRFRRLNQLSNSLYELELNKKTIKLNLPLHIGFFVYQYAKLRMLEFYYDFLDYYIDRSNFQYVTMDTDSAYLALSAPSMDDVIKPDLKKDFFSKWDNWFPAEACSKHKQQFVETKLKGKEWVLNKCCQERKSFDLRSPGLYKVEWQGNGIVGLCSKTYYCFGSKDKLSCKGLNKRQNDLRKEEYLTVLKEGRAGEGTNEGFRIKNNKIMTYRETRAGLSYFYPKRKVQEDGVSTLPIDL